METNDTKFKEFLEKLTQQNSKDLALQALQVKYEREMAGEDNDRREEQLKALAELLEKIEQAVTGIKIDVDFEPVKGLLENQTQILQKMLEEQAILRKVSEGSLEYDKESAQYRNTSGREVESLVSGKTVKKGGYIDFETASDRLTGQGKRVRESEANQLKLKPIEQGRKTPLENKQVTAKVSQPKETTKEGEITSFGNLADLGDAIGARLSGIFSFMTKDVKERGLFGKNTGVEDKKPEAIDMVTGKNPESDNVVDSQEMMADNSKEDLELSKQALETQKQQLEELKQIREALAPKTPSELPGGKTAAALTGGTGTTALEGGGLSLPDIPLGGKPKTPAPNKPGAPSKLGRMAKIGGAALAIGAGAYTAYKGYTEAEDSKQARLEEVQTKLDAGEISPEEAAAKRNEIGNTATIEKSGAVGEGTGLAGGAIAGGLAGAKLGATLGTFVGGPVGTAIGGAIGGLAGGALGAFAGSGAGKFIGEKVGSGINAVKNFFGGKEEPGKKAQEAVAGKEATTTTDVKFNEVDFAEKDPETYKKFKEFEKEKTNEIYQKEIEKLKLDKDAPPQVLKKVRETSAAKAKVEAVETFKKEIEATGAGKVTTKTEQGAPSVSSKTTGAVPEEKSLIPKVTSQPTPVSSDTNVTGANKATAGLQVAKTSTENADMARQTSSAPTSVTPIVSSNVNNVNTTSYVPIKPTPRPELSGSALDRYQSRISAY